VDPKDQNISIELLKQQDKKMFELLYDKYSGALYNIILKITLNEQVAQDTLQEGFIKIWKNIQSYDEQKGSIFTWMLNVCRNTAIDVTRSKAYKPTIQKNVDDLYDNQNTVPEININAIGLTKIMSTLKKEHYQVLHRIYLMGYTQSQTAEELNLPIGTVKTRVRNALLELKQIYAV
jgi:RNA polymerase sigma factor (sigma-70 family)